METTKQHLIEINNCRIESSHHTLIDNFSFLMRENDAYLVIGDNRSGEKDFIDSLSGKLGITPNPTPLSNYTNIFSRSIETVSLEAAARIIEEERENDDSDYVEGGVDIGRTGRFFIASGMTLSREKAEIDALSRTLDSSSEVKLCGIEGILDRGLKYMSTGEIRRVMLARALLSQKKLLILSDIFSGLDVLSRSILFQFFSMILKRQTTLPFESNVFPTLIFSSSRYFEIPEGINRVIEWKDHAVSFSGTRSEYEALLRSRAEHSELSFRESRNIISQNLKSLSREVDNMIWGEETLRNTVFQNCTQDTPLVEMRNVFVHYDSHIVLENFNWTVHTGEHFLITGPNGSGKTTLLELITGDNMQVFSNDVRLFGKKRGSGETIWDIRHRLGIASYRLHVEYRMISGISLECVIISGLRDTIGLYEAKTSLESSLARKWLDIGGFSGRYNETFSNLSYGEQRAILILRSAVKCPPLLILDEPCHALDENHRARVLHLLELISNLGTSTLLHVTHEPSEAVESEHHTLELIRGSSHPTYRIGRR